MKKVILIIVALLFTAVAFAQGDSLDPSFSAIKSLFLPALGASGLLLWSDTIKHIKAGDWDFWTFVKTKLKAWVVVNVSAIAIYLVISYWPFSKSLIEALAGSELASYSAVGFIALATRIYDDFFVKKPA